MTMILAVLITIAFYSIVTFLVHVTIKSLFPTEFNALTPRRRLQLDFRGMRIFAGIKCIICFSYGMFVDHNLGLVGTNRFTRTVFETYLGYTLFEVGFIICCTNKITDVFCKPSLRLLVLHHVVVGSASYAMLKPGPSPHYLGLITLGNEAVVISYAIIQVANILGYPDHKIVEYNTLSLPVQYTVRQIIFYYLSYMMFANYNELIEQVCTDWFSYSAFFIGMNLLGLVINPYWTWEVYQDVYTFYRNEKLKRQKKNLDDKQGTANGHLSTRNDAKESTQMSNEEVPQNT